MDKYAYMETVNQIMMIGRIVADMPLAEFINAISYAETVAAVVDPTLYVQTYGTADDLKNLANGLMKFQAEVMKIKERVEGG